MGVGVEFSVTLATLAGRCELVMTGASRITNVLVRPWRFGAPNP